MARLVLKRGADGRIRAGHPWIYRGEIADLSGRWTAGVAVDVVDAGGRFLGRGFYNPRPSLACRLLTRRADEPVDAAFFLRRLPRGARLPRGGAGGRCRLSPLLERGRWVARARGGPLRARQRAAVPDPRHGAGDRVDHRCPRRPLSRGAGVPARRCDRGAHRGLRARARLDRAGRARRGDHRRGAVSVRRHAGRRPQDGLLSRPARQPRPRGGPRPRPTGARRLLLHGRLRLRGARRRRHRRAPPRVLGRGARGRAEKPRAERARRPGRAAPGQCLRRAPPARGGEGAVRRSSSSTPRRSRGARRPSRRQRAATRRSTCAASGSSSRAGSSRRSPALTTSRSRSSRRSAATPRAMPALPCGCSPP